MALIRPQHTPAHARRNNNDKDNAQAPQKTNIHYRKMNVNDSNIESIFLGATWQLWEHAELPPNAVWS